MEYSAGMGGANALQYRVPLMHTQPAVCCANETEFPSGSYPLLHVIGALRTDPVLILLLEERTAEYIHNQSWHEMPHQPLNPDFLAKRLVERTDTKRRGWA